MQDTYSISLKFFLYIWFANPRNPCVLGQKRSVSSSNSSAQALPQLSRSLGIKARVLMMLCRVLHIYCVHPPTTPFWSHWPSWCFSHKHPAPASGHVGSYSLACNASPKDPHGFLLHLLPSWPSYLKLPPYSFPQILTSSLFFLFLSYRLDAFIVCLLCLPH